MTTLTNTKQTTIQAPGGVRVVVTGGASKASRCNNVEELAGGFMSLEGSGGIWTTIPAATLRRAMPQDGAEEIRRGAGRSLLTLSVTSCSGLFQMEARVPGGTLLPYFLWQ